MVHHGLVYANGSLLFSWLFYSWHPDANDAGINGLYGSRRDGWYNKKKQL